ncbi:hypothetical protein KIPB_015676, partial [Kipferlia bialata]|eukprot:g15676.t1
MSILSTYVEKSLADLAGCLALSGDTDYPTLVQ